MDDRKRRFLAELLLATVTVFWGATFPMVKGAVGEVPVMCFLWVRFALATALLAIFAGPKGFATLDARGLRRGMFLGALLFGSYAFQTFGLERTSAANAGFLTGLNVAWVPILCGPLLGKKPAPGAKIGVVCAVVGLFLLTFHWPWRLALGDGLVVICSLFVALHILGLDSLTAGYDGRALAAVQIGTMTLMCLAYSLLFEPVTVPPAWSKNLVVAVVVTGVFATSYAFWVQTSFQRWTTPTRAALIYTLEPVFAALFSVMLAGERLTSLGWIGGGLIVVGMVIAEAFPMNGSATATTPEKG